MSQNTSSTATEYRDFLWTNYITYSMTVAYEYIFSAGNESVLIWQQKWSGTTLLFMLNRYIMVFTMVYELIPLTSHTCYSTHILTAIIALLPCAISAAFSALRAYALSNRYRPLIFFVVLFLGLVQSFINGVAMLYKPVILFVNDPILGALCEYPMPAWQTSKLKLVFSLATRSSLVVSDIIVLVITWKRTFQSVREATQMGLQANLSATLLRDGSMYFLVSCVLNIATVIFTLATSVGMVDNIGSVIITSLQPILISRFIMNLRQTQYPNSSTELARESQFMPQFRVPTLISFQGNMGEPLEFGAHDDEEDHADAEIRAGQRDTGNEDRSDDMIPTGEGDNERWDEIRAEGRQEAM